ncbi:hypothetical protein WJX84_000204 [Apatococcus fuscideae]|uniref:SAM dependent carboxyl methyltransferase n=1 Tax=Apatococcus fuscideae TaxID=2026836 RepID=A0AAW1T8X1_9CHLO
MPGQTSAGVDYDKGSSNQSAANKAAVHWLQEAAAASKAISPGVINILDLGSATGKNSAGELKAFVEAVRQSEGDVGQDIIITHVDTSGNDWNQLCRTVMSSPISYLAGSERVYSHAQARSFFEQVAPAGSVALAYSGISFHWMSQSQPLSDCWVQHPDTKDRKTYAANQQQAARDWLQLLQMRAQELLPGGYLVATAATLEDSESFNHLVAMVYQAWREAAKQGAITEQEFKSFAGGHWLRSREEWLAPLHKELKDEFEVLELQEGSTTDPHWVEYSKAGTCDGDEGPRALAEGYAKFMFGVLAGQECESLVAGQWLRTREEWLAPLQGELKDHFELLEFHESSVTDAHWKIFQESTGNDADKAHALAEGYSKFFFGITPGLVNAHLTQRAQAEKDRILEVMKAEYIGLVSAHPTELRLPFALIVLRRK